MDCMWDPSSGNRRPCDDDDSLDSFKRARTMNPNEGYYDVLTNVIRNVDTTRDQWLDPGRSSRVWPDPPINGRALTLEAFMGVSSGDSWTMTKTSGSNMNWATDFYIGLSEVDDPDAFGFTGTVLGSRNYFGDQKLGSDGPRMDGFFNPDGKAQRTPRLPPCRFEFPNPDQEAGGGLSLRCIYEPHFISTPYDTGLAFDREGLDCERTSEPADNRARVVRLPRVDPGLPTYDRFSTTNKRAENRDFGVSHTLKVPTGGIGGNPFWLRDSKAWPDILASLHFDFMPFLVPQAPTRPITYRFWDTLYSTALFGGPTFAVVLDDYGIFDEEFYRMVIRHYNQSEAQIHAWREQKKLPFNEEAGYPQSYINPQLLYEASQKGLGPVATAADGHPFPDMPASFFHGGAFSMAGWQGACAELCFAPPDRLTDAGNTYHGLRPYSDSKERLSMGEKRKLHDQSNLGANPNAVQDFYYTFVLGPSGEEAEGGSDVFQTTDVTITPEMLSHRFRGEKASDTPFAYGGRVRRLMNATLGQASTKDRNQTLDDMFAPGVDASDPAVTGLYPAITGSSNRFVVDKLTAVQNWAWERIQDYGKEKLAIAVEEVAAVIEKNFPKLASAVRTVYATLAEDSIANPFQSGANLLDGIGAKAASMVKDFASSVANTEGVAPELGAALTAYVQKIAKSIFSKTPISGPPGDEEMQGANEAADFGPNEGMEMPELLPKAEAVIGDVTEGLNVVEGAAEGAEATATGVELATEVTAGVMLAGESLLTSVAGPMVLALAVTMALQAWERAMDEAAKADAAKSKMAVRWAEWDGMRIPFDATELSRYDDGTRLAHLTGNMYEAYTMGNVNRLLAMMEDMDGDDYDVAQLNDMRQWAGNWDPATECQGQYADKQAPKGSYAWYRANDACLADPGKYLTWFGRLGYSGAGYKPTSARYLNFDKSAGELGGDLRTVANLIAMNHLTLSCVSMDGLLQDKEARPERMRAAELLQMAEIVRTLRVVDYYLRAGTWAGGEGSWKPFPPVRGIPTSLFTDHMTPIPAVSAFDLDETQLDGFFKEAMQSQLKRGKAGATAFLDAIEGRSTVLSEQFMPGVWEAYVERIAAKYGVAPTYVYKESTRSGPDGNVVDVVREIPVPIFAPGRSPTMFVSSTDPTMAWPTRAMKGVMMSSFNDESRYFTVNKIDVVPSASNDPQQDFFGWFAGKPPGATFGGPDSRFILAFRPSTDAQGDAVGKYTIHNESTVPVVLVNVDQLSGTAAISAPTNKAAPDTIEPSTMYACDGSTVAAGEATFYITAASLYPGPGSIDPTNPWHEWLDDWVQTLGRAYRSYSFVATLKAVPGVWAGLGGTIVVLDNNHSYSNLTLFQERMENRVMPIVRANPACYEALQYFYESDFPLLRTLKGADLDDVCDWLNAHIPEPTKVDGVPTVLPQDADRQVMIHVLASRQFATAKTKIAQKMAEWEDTYNESPSADDKKKFKLAHNCGGPPSNPDVPTPGGTPNTPDVPTAPANSHPRTTPEGGLVFDRVLKIGGVADSELVAFQFEPELTTIKGLMTSVGQAADFGAFLTAAENRRYTPVIAHARELAEAVLNNQNDQFDATKTIMDPAASVVLPAALIAQVGTLLAACEGVRIARIAACKKLQAAVDANIVLGALDAMPPASGGTASAVEAVRMFFDVRLNKGVSFQPFTGLATYRGMHKLLAEACKRTYKPEKDRFHMTNPDTKDTAFYVSSGPLKSTDETVVFYIPLLREPEIMKKTLIVAFRGTDVQKDIDSKFKKKKASVFQKLAAAVTPYSDLYSDIKILTGTQAESERFKAAEAFCDGLMADYKSYAVLLTGHSLGGAIGMHCLQYMISKGFQNVRAVVFNPGKGLDQVYFDAVKAEIAAAKPGMWYQNLTTYRIGGESSWPLDDDPVSVLSGGLGTTFLVEGPGVPKFLEAHSSKNFDTTAVLPYYGSGSTPTPG